MSYLKALEKKVEFPQFFREIGYKCGKKELWLTMANDTEGELLCLPRCKVDKVPAKWLQTNPDPLPSAKPGAVKLQKGKYDVEALRQFNELLQEFALTHTPKPLLNPIPQIDVWELRSDNPHWDESRFPVEIKKYK
jgi:hypothetical protein